MLTGARAARTVIGVSGSQPQRAQQEEERQGHERYQEPRPHGRSALAAREIDLGGMLGHGRQRE
jgi:hypothetical protein